jgi:hypothetical protein
MWIEIYFSILEETKVVEIQGAAQKRAITKQFKRCLPKHSV